MTPDRDVPRTPRQRRSGPEAVHHPKPHRELGLADGLGGSRRRDRVAIIPIDNASVNPARSIATAVYGGSLAVSQVWVFIVFPIIGGLIAGFAYRALFDGTQKKS